MKPFTIRSYSFQELALYYFPDVSGECALGRLRRWIDYSEELHCELEALRFSGRQWLLTPQQVERIVARLTEPPDFVPFNISNTHSYIYN